MRGRLGRGEFRRQFGISADVVYQYGLRDSHDMQQWAQGRFLLDQWTYFDESVPRLGWMRLLARWPRCSGGPKGPCTTDSAAPRTDP
jgi:hypothetical protein